MKKYIISIVFLAIGLNVGLAQTQKAYIKAAEEAFANKNYYGALVWFTEALDFQRDNPQLIYKVAESARKFQAYDMAAERYKLIVDSLGEDNFPEAALYLGEMYQRLGKYDDAKKYYTIYLTEHGGENESLTNQANKAMASVDYAIVRHKEIDKSANMIDMEAAVNTPFSEFGALNKDDVMYFSTMRYAEKKSDHFPKRGISKIHTIKEGVNMLLEGSINESDSLIAHNTFSTDGSMLYYTICEYLNDEEIRCDIYSRMVNEDGSFGSKTKLPSTINVDSVTNTQPQISYDSILQSDVMYFVSNRPGGLGKLDIYYSVINSDGSFQEPINLKAMNTPENEATPFYHTPTKTLYFSSDGRLGLGGYDVYASEKSKEGWNEPKNLRVPINSSFHDLYYMLNKTSEEALFSSNREGSMYLDPAKKACCFDIYKVNYDEIIIDLNALVFDALTQEELNGATLYLIGALRGDTIKSLTNDEGNDFYFKIRKEREYILRAERLYYNSESIAFSTVGITESTTINKKIYLKTDRTQLIVTTFNDRTKLPLEGVEITITNLTAKKIDTIAINEISNNFHFYIENGSKYEIKGAKFGFVTAFETVDLTEVSDPVHLKRELYLDVFDIEDYMPVTVYFENDHPNPQSKSTNTDAVYGNLFSRYLGEKKEHLKNYAKNRSGQEKLDAEGRIDKFFEGDVVGGYDKLKRFMRALKKELELGRNLEIAIKGYASPLADTRYNLTLGQRRVQSVKNEILNYENGVFRKYVSEGKLILTDISFGEETSPKDLSDKKSDPTQSVYSVAASRERRVQIVKITDQ